MRRDVCPYPGFGRSIYQRPCAVRVLWVTLRVMHYAVLNTPMGPLTVASTDKGVASIRFGANVPRGNSVDESSSRETVQQLSEYFEGKRTAFDLPLDVEGTAFQKAVWNELLRIPYGETRSYGDIARAIGRPGAARAVGMANHDNPVAVVIPCHRVVGKDGSLTGYAGGLHLKAQLLSIERQNRTLFT
jgi:methylated-DNA-[protein]-cysteine S-methyltransferase